MHRQPACRSIQSLLSNRVFGLKLSSQPKMEPYSFSFVLPFFMVVAALISGVAAATVFIVGNNGGWVLPASATILVNDTIVFRYNKSVDSVMRVSEEEYISCIPRTVSSKENFTTVFRFPTSGRFYFVSSKYSNCSNGEKLSIVVGYSPSPATVKEDFSLHRFSCCQANCCDAENPLCCE